MILRTVFLVFLFGFVAAQEFDVDGDLGLDSLGNLTSILDKFQSSEADSLAKLCKDESKREDVKAAGKAFVTCTSNLISLKNVQDEIAKAKKGDLDIVFKKYCDQVPSFKNCLKDFTQAVEPCLDESQLVNREKAVNVTNLLMEFACYQDGDRIAVFVASGGIQCLQNSSEAVKGCIEDTYTTLQELNKTISEAGTNDPSAIASNPDVQNILLKTADCQKLEAAQKCVVEVMDKKCKESTPSNVAEALFNFVRIQTNTCKPSGSGASTLAVFTILPITLVAFLRYL